MTTTQKTSAATSERLQANLQRIDELSQRLLAALARRPQRDANVAGPGPELFIEAAGAWAQEAMLNPARLIGQQAAWWSKTLQHYIEAQQAMIAGAPPPTDDAAPADRRFANPLWDSNPYFNLLKRQYLLNAEAITSAVDGLENLEGSDRQRLEYFTRQIVDMMSPTNFFGTNPDALERAAATEGESLVRGLENLVRDLEANDGELLVTLADPTAFEVGRNIGTTPGTVVFRNRILELIQFAPTTDKVHRTPLLIFPPWINKYYILDLKPQNSLIRWIVDQGYTLFVVSWKNPDATYADFGIDDYIDEGFLTAIDTVKRITGEKRINAIGYCIAGTTLALTLALMARRRDNSVRSATFFTTLTDFSDQGEFAPFLTDDFLSGIEREVATRGYLAAPILSRTFSFLRSNDLIYQPAIRSYMLGEPPPAFDLLYWNGDSTNLPARMAVEYLRGLCQDDNFATGNFVVDGETISPADIKLPICAIGCETDHIAAWKASFNGIRRFGSGDKTFILSQSGHIAGIVNPPGKDKYGHYTNAAPLDDLDPDSWRAGATFTPGSWWPRWREWLRPHSGALIAARQPGSHPDYPALEPAPGQYVRREPAPLAP